MKFKLSISLLIIFCIASFAQQRSESQPLVHATYLVGNRIKSRSQLDNTQFSQFNCMYVMAGSSWEAEDFILPEEQIMNKLVRDFSYSTGESGLALVPELITRAHHEKLKVLLSIPGSNEFNPIASDSAKRALFARVMAAFIKKYDYNGLAFLPVLFTCASSVS